LPWAICLLLLLALALSAHAELGVPALTGRVVDQAGLLSAEQLQAVEKAILDLEAASGGQMAILALPTLAGGDLEGFAIRVAEKWQIGHQGKDDGAILLIASEDRKIRLEIGYGWEGPINDARAGDIIRGMGPYFRSQDYAGGMTYAVRKVQEFVTGSVPVDLDGDAGVTPDTTPVEVPGWVALVLFLGIVVVFIVFGRSARGGGRGRSSGWTFSSGGGSSFSSSSFSGGGGSFGGGGASGGW
jgi:uncharacterized protein